jgi:hypothetical protein
VAVREAERIDYEGVPAKVFRAEHIVAIAASVGRQKDKAPRRKSEQSAPHPRPSPHRMGRGRKIFVVAYKML